MRLSQHLSHPTNHLKALKVIGVERAPIVDRYRSSLGEKTGTGSKDTKHLDNPNFGSFPRRKASFGQPEHFIMQFQNGSKKKEEDSIFGSPS